MLNLGSSLNLWDPWRHCSVCHNFCKWRQRNQQSHSWCNHNSWKGVLMIEDSKTLNDELGIEGTEFDWNSISPYLNNTSEVQKWEFHGTYDISVQSTTPTLETADAQGKSLVETAEGSLRTLILNRIKVGFQATAVRALGFSVTESTCEAGATDGAGFGKGSWTLNL